MPSVGSKSPWPISRCGARVAAAAAVTLIAWAAGHAAAPAPAPAVAAPDRYGADTGAEILGAGGNAADAAVAIAFTLAVTYPEAGNLGGGGFATVLFDGKADFLDYRERAPASASAGMYLDAAGKVCSAKIRSRAPEQDGRFDYGMIREC